MTNSLAMAELCALMMQRKLDSERFTQWVEIYYGLPDIHGSAELVRWVAFHHQEPHPLDRLRVREFDKFLTRPGVEDCEFTRALIELRNVFARNANLAASSVRDEPVSLSLSSGERSGERGPPASPSGQGEGKSMQRANPPASAELAEVLARLLCAEGRKATGARAELLEAVAPST